MWKGAGMSSKTFDGIVESGEIKLKNKVPLPDNTRVIIVVPDFQVPQSGRLVSPRLKYPKQAADFEMEVIEEAVDAGL
jgi:hypothetical protein